LEGLQPTVFTPLHLLDYTVSNGMIFFFLEMFWGIIITIDKGKANYNLHQSVWPSLICS